MAATPGDASLAWRRISGLMLIVRLGGSYALLFLVRRVLPQAWYQQAIQRTHARGAQRLRAYMLRYGGLLIKIGQYIASRPDMFPLTYVDTLSGLRDTVPPRPLQALRGQLDTAYEGRLQQHLTHIEEDAIAAASFGQVHRGRSVDGTPVAIKIQYPGLAAGVAIDLRMVRLATWLFRPFFPGWPLHLIVEEIERSSREEMDYLFEGRNADLLRDSLLEHGLRVPRVFWEHTRETILVMEFAPGVSLAQCDLAALPQSQREALAERIIDGFLQQLLRDRFFHADPHGGNLLLDIKEDGSCDLWLIDFGMTAHLTSRESELYGRFLAHLQVNDTDGMVDVLAQLGYLLPGGDREGLKNLAREVYGQLGSFNPQTFKGSRRQLELAGQINTFIRRMQGLTFPRHTLLLSRATALIEGLCMELLPDRNILAIIKPRLSRFLTWQTRLRWLRATFMDEVQRWRLVPDRLQSIDQGLSRLLSARSQAMTVVIAVVLLTAAVLYEVVGPWPSILAGIALLLTLRR
ncbi:MAG: AarF/ABC1/UbiB kinase family protein [Planctomycetota bacterium]|nr:MAG: AarF/ABC1/UbiB kinase family protein [Planctomycetota bacterium]